MSHGVPCVCSGPTQARRKNWRVTLRCANRSAFSGYHWTRSRYSAIKCLMCGRRWRTAAAYVMALPDATTP